MSMMASRMSIVKKEVPANNATNKNSALAQKIELNTQVLQEVKRTQNEIQQIIDQTGTDEMKLKLSNFLKLMLESAGEISDPPVNYFINRASYEGSSQDDACNLSVTLEITVLTDHWTRIPLLADSLALLNSSIKYKQIFDNMDNIDNSKTTPGASAEELTSLGVVNSAYTLLAYYSGSYIVQLDILVPYQTSRKTGFYMLVPKASQNDIRFKVLSKDILIKIDPALFSKQFYESNLSSVESRFPPTKTLSVQWTENLGNLEKKDEKVEISSTAEQKILISIGEGVITFTNKVSFYIVSGQMSLFEIQVDKRIKVLSVEGPKQKPVKRWEAKKVEKKHILKVWLEYGVEDSYTFTVTSELEMKSKSDTLKVPTFSCLATKDVTREKGMIAIEARTNVEVEEVSSSGLGSLGVNEISEDLFSMSTDSVLLGYKYLYPNFKLSINIKKHADVGVLIAIIDAASFCTTITSQGQYLHRLVLDVRNTQKQFVRVTLPHDTFEIWSSTVAGTAVKPARDEKGNVLIPLVKTSKLDDNQSSTFNVVLVYITKNEPLGEKGHLKVQMGYCDIPVNKVYVEVFIPSNYKCIEWKGMKDVEYFSGNVPSAGAGEAQQGWGHHQQRNRKVKLHSQAPTSNVMMDRRSSIRMDLNENLDYMEEKEQLTSLKEMNFSGYSKAVGKSIGVIPVKVDIPQVGTSYKFEQLLVSNKFLEVRTDYAKVEKGACQRRSVDACIIM